MAININSKKKWHPSRIEIQQEVIRFESALEQANLIGQEERIRILTYPSEKDISYFIIDE